RRVSARSVRRTKVNARSVRGTNGGRRTIKPPAGKRAEIRMRRGMTPARRGRTTTAVDQGMADKARADKGPLKGRGTGRIVVATGAVVVAKGADAIFG